MSGRRVTFRSSALTLLTLTFLAAACHYDDDDVECFRQGATIICVSDVDDHFHYHGLENDGTLTVALTDSALDLKSFSMTFTELVLLSEEVEPQTLYRSEEGLRVDLLSLRGTAQTRLYELLSRQPLPPAAYSGFRLFFREPAIVTEAGRVDHSGVDLAAGSIDVTFQTPLLLGPTEERFVVLDFDVSQSVDAPGDEAAWTVRPVVVAEMLESPEELATPIDVEGQVVEVNEDGGFTLELEDSRGVAVVSVEEEATVVLESGARPASLDAVEIGRRALVRGLFREDEGLEAQVIAFGPTEQLELRVASASADGSFTAHSQESNDEALVVSVGPEAEVSRRRLQSDGEEEIAPGSRARLIGWSADEEDPQGTRTLYGGILDFEDPSVPLVAPERLDGIVTQLFPRSRSIRLELDDGTLRTLPIDEEAEILFVELRRGVLWQTSATFHAVNVGDRLRVSLSPDGASAVRVVIVEDASTSER